MGRDIVHQSDDECVKAERLLKRLEEKDLEMLKEWVDEIARAWQTKGESKSLYIANAYGKG